MENADNFVENADNSVLDLHDLVLEYLQTCQARGLAPATVRGYRWALSRLLLGCPEFPISHRELLPIVAAPGLSQESCRDLARALRTFFHWVELEHQLPNPCARLPKLSRRKCLPRVLSDDEVRRVLDACETPQERALVCLVLSTGLRLGEVAGLTWPDVYPHHLRVTGKVGDRQVTLSNYCLGMLATLGDGHAIWTGHEGRLTISGVQQVYQRIFRRSGLGGKKLGPHVLRHTFATMYIRSGGKVNILQELLGHQDLQTTMIYVHLDAHDVALDHAQHDPLRLFTMPALQAAEGRGRQVN